MTKTTDRPYKNVADDKLRDQIDQLEREFQSMRKDQGRHREDAHDRIDAMRQSAQATIGQQMDSIRFAVSDREVTLGEMQPLAALWTIAHDDSLTEALHAAVDAPSLSGLEKMAEGTRADWDAERDRLRREVAVIEAELMQRQAEAEMKAAQARISELRMAAAA